MTAQIIHQLSSKRLPLGQLAPLSAPLVIYVEVSSYCNLACNFCPHHLDPDKINKQNMDINIFKKIIDDIKKMEKPIKMLRICGTGDALFNKNLPEMLDYAGLNKNFEKFELITNGLLLNEKIMLSLTKNLTRLIISIEGLSSDDYMEFTNRKIDYEKHLDNLKHLFNNKNNCNIHIKIHNNSVKTEEKKELFIDTFKTIADEIYIENLVDLWPNTDASYVTSKDHRFLKLIPKRKEICSQIFKTMQVNSDGSVIPCSIDWEAKNKIGDIKEKSLEEIWNGEEMKNIRMKHLMGERREINPCNACSFNETSDTDDVDQYAKDILSRL